MAWSISRRLVDASRNALLVPDTAALSTLGHAVCPRSPKTMVKSGRLCDTVQSRSQIFHLQREKSRKQEILPSISWLLCLEGAFPVLAASQVLVPRQDLINVCDYRVPRGYSWYLFVFRGEELVLESLFHPFLKVAQTRDIPSAISLGHVIVCFYSDIVALLFP